MRYDQYCMLNIVYSVLYTQYCILSIVCSILYTQYCILNITYSVLYTQYCYVLLSNVFQTFYNERHVSFRVIIIISEVFYLVEVHSCIRTCYTYSYVLLMLYI